MERESLTRWVIGFQILTSPPCLPDNIYIFSFILITSSIFFPNGQIFSITQIIFFLFNQKITPFFYHFVVSIIRISIWYGYELIEMYIASVNRILVLILLKIYIPRYLIFRNFSGIHVYITEFTVLIAFPALNMYWLYLCNNVSTPRGFRSNFQLVTYLHIHKNIFHRNIYFIILFTYNGSKEFFFFSFSFERKNVICQPLDKIYT